jgi:hypothetical protein
VSQPNPSYSSLLWLFTVKNFFFLLWIGREKCWG